MVYLSDDVEHDHHAVYHYTSEALELLKKNAPAVDSVYLFSDGCSSQYKGKGTFADLSLYSGMNHQFDIFICY